MPDHCDPKSIQLSADLTTLSRHNGQERMLTHLWTDHLRHVSLTNQQSRLIGQTLTTFVGMRNVDLLRQSIALFVMQKNEGERMCVT